MSLPVPSLADLQSDLELLLTAPPWHDAVLARTPTGQPWPVALQ